MNLFAFTSQILECIAASFRLEAEKHPSGSEEYDTFHDAADALDDALALIEDLNV